MNGNGERGAQVIQPSPIPTTIVVGRVSGPKGPFVLLTFQTAQGVSHFFLDTETAKKIGMAVSQAAGGLIVGGAMPPPGPD